MSERNGQEGPWIYPKTRASRAEYLEFVKVLHGVGTTCSRFFRKVMREVIGQGPDLLPIEMKPIKDATFQVSALGRNLNQILKAYHAGQPTPPGILVDEAALSAFRDQVEQLKQALVSIILRTKQRWLRHE
jgi:hypothetical protein